MPVAYDTRKDLPCRALADLFHAVGWSSERETDEKRLAFYNVPFLNSTLVVSAWDGEKLVGCVRVLSDRIFRSVIYDLAVLPEYQRQGIGRELIRRCISEYPDSEWLLETIPERVSFYEQQGFHPVSEPVMRIPCRLF